MIAGALGVAGLTGRAIGALQLASLLSDAVPMALITGLVIVVASALTISVIVSGASDHVAALRSLAGAAIASVGVGTLAEYLLRGDWARVPSVYTVANVRLTSYFAGVIAPTTAAAFALTGLAMLLRARGTSRKLPRVLESGTLTLAWLVLLGYAYGADWLQSFGAPVHMAITTAAALALLTFATLIGFPREPLGRILNGSGPPSMTARWLLPVALLGPAIVGAVRLQGEMLGYFDARGGLTIFVSTMSMMFVAVSLFLIFRLQVMFERAEEQLRGVRWASAIVDSTHEAVISTTLGGEIVSWNAAAETLYGYPPSAAVGQSVRILFPGEQSRQLDELLSEVAAGRPVELHDVDLLTSRHDPVSVTLTASPLSDGVGTIAGVSVISRDLSEVKKLRKEAERTTRLVSIGRLATQIAHELNNVLMGIQPFVDVLLKRFAGDREVERPLSFITKAVNRGSGITHGVLKYSRPVAPKPRLVDLRTWTDSVMAELAGVCGPNLLLRSAMNVHGTAEFDPDQMAQVVINLGTNGRDAMGGAGELSVAINEGPAGGLEILVSDTGSGIHPADMQHLFEPLFTTKPTGTGLGLAISHQIVIAHGGSIEVESDVAAGTIMKVTLPNVLRGVPMTETAPVNAPPDVAAAGRVLVVDDEKPVLVGLTMLLELEGFTVTTAQTGDEAVSLADDGLSAIVLDVRLGDDDGREVYARIRRKGVTAPVIFSTGHVQPDDLAGLQDAVVLLKPYTFNRLLAELSRAIRSRQSGETVGS